MKKLHYLLFALIMGLSVSMTSCSDDDDSSATPKDETMTIAQVKALVTSDAAVLISEDKIFDGIVTSNNAESSNFYKSIYIQDETGAIKISCDKPADKDAEAVYESYEIGQKVQVNLKDLYVGKANGLFYVGTKSDDAKYIVGLIADADIATKIVKVDGGVAVEAATATIGTLTDDMIGTLVKFEKVQVLREDSKKAIIDGIKLVDESKNTINLYVYKYSPLKSIATPQGSGVIAGILYKSDAGYSLSLRLESEIEMEGASFDDGTEVPTETQGGVVGDGINAGTYTGSGAADLFISEYVEGSSYNKYIEIFNGTGADVELSGYSLGKDGNGSGEFSLEPLSGTLPNGAVIVLANGQADLKLLNDGVVVIAHGGVNHNGDDQVALFKGETEIDRIGIAGDVDWGKEKTFRRKSSVVTGKTGENNANDNGEWDVFEQNAVDGIGTHTIN